MISRGNYQFDKHKNAPSTTISSMRDMQKMYEPPIPKHLIPTNNPFYNKSLITSGSLNGTPIGKKSVQKSSPRSLLTWINSPNTKRVQQKMANRVGYLKFLANNKDALVSDVAIVSKKKHR